MRENIMKLSSIAVIFFLLLSVMLVMVGPISFAESGDDPQTNGMGIPGKFAITYINMTAATAHNGVGQNHAISNVSTAANWGYELQGTVEICWSAPAGDYTGANCSLNGYNVTISPTGGKGQGGYDVTTVGGGTNRHPASNLKYTWDTTHWADGEYWINVTAHGSNGTGGAARAHRNASNGPIKVVVRNTLPATPGINQWQGGNYSACGATPTTRQVLTSTTANYEVGDNVSSFRLSSAATWDDAKTYRLYKPYYNGSDATTDTYALDYYQHSSVELTTDSGPAVTFDRAGLWVIDRTDNLANSEWSDADLHNASQFNSTVDAWFWVNTSTDYTMSSQPSSLAYNSSGALSIDIFDEDGDQPTAGSIDPVVDIRYDTNGSSIRSQNMRATTWTYGYFYKNNSYSGSTWPGTKGFWNAGNYTIYSYTDTDRAYGATSGENGLQYYTKAASESTTNGWKHYNNTYGAGPNENASAGWLYAVTDYNWSFAGPWDPPEHNTTIQNLQVTTRTPFTEVDSGNYTMYWGFAGEVNISLAKRTDGPAFTPSDVKVFVFNASGKNSSDNFTFNYCEGDGTPGMNWGTQTGDSRPGNISVYRTKYRTGYVHINMTTWGKDNRIDPYSVGENGTWKAKIYVDYSFDGTKDRETNGVNKQYTEEYNVTVNFKVKKAPKIQFKWIDDDGDVAWGTGNKNNDGVIPYIPTVASVPLDVEFYVYDQGGDFFGQVTAGLESGKCSSTRETAANITIYGDSLFTGRLIDFPGYGLSATACGYSSGVWSIPIIPVMSEGGGTITIKVVGYNTSATQTISIGGANYDQNGTIVTVTPNEFDIDQNKTLSITAAYADDANQGMRGTTAYLFYIDDGTLVAADACNPIGSLTNFIAKADAPDSTVSILLNKTMQTDNQTGSGNGHANFGAAKAPRNLTVFIDGVGNRNGYALVQLKPVGDLELEASHETLMAGYEYDNFFFNVTLYNTTTVPKTTATDKAAFQIKIRNEDGDDVTGTSNSDTNQLLQNIYDSVLTGSYVPDTYKFEFDGVYGIDEGTYTVSAYNNTHRTWSDTTNHNVTIVIKPVEVTCDKSPFYWKADSNISATFTMTYDGEPVDGSLTIDNMSDAGSFNKTWTNCSFNGNSDAGGNNSIEISEDEIVNGVVTVDEITASELHPDIAKQYITFWFRPTLADGSSGQYAKTKFNDGGTLKHYMNVEVPAVIPDPQYIPLGRTTKVYCDVHGRDADPISDIYIRLHGAGYDKNSRSDIDGRVSFSITPAATGNISIDVGEINRTLADTVIYVTSWVLDVDAPAQVNEGDQFTVTITKEGTTEVVVGATITINGIGSETTDANGQATFNTVPISSDRAYTIIASKEGYAPDPNTVTITVINIPNLIISVTTEDDGKVSGGSTFAIAVAKDTGDPVIGATVTFNSKTYTTGAGGALTLTAPSVTADTNYDITATFQDFEPATKTITVKPGAGTPGFELLTLLVALGVAFILLRRRRN